MPKDKAGQKKSITRKVQNLFRTHPFVDTHHTVRKKHGMTDDKHRFVKLWLLKREPSCDTL